MRAPLSCTFLLSLLFTTPSTAEEAAYRIVTMVSYSHECTYRVEKQNWLASLDTILRNWVGEWVYGVEIRETKGVQTNNIDEFRATFNKTYELYAEDGYGKKVLYKVIELKGIASSSPDMVFIKVNNDAYAGGNMNQPVKLMKCKSSETEGLSNEERINLLKSHETQRLRELETSIGDTVDDATSIGAKAAAGLLPLGAVTEPLIDAAVERSKAERAKNVNNSSPSALENANSRQIESREMCNSFLGAGTCQ